MRIKNFGRTIEAGLLAMQFFALLMLLSFSLSAQEVYKSKDKDGNVIFSDSAPTKDAKPIRSTPLNVVGSNASGNQSLGPDTPPAAAAEEKSSKAALSIVNPGQGQTLRNIRGKLTVSVQSNLPPKPGNRVAITLDGRKKTSRGLSIEFVAVHRGEHRVTARLIDRGGNVLARAKPVVFYVQETSVLQNRAAGG